jgi:hypothetical protein
MKVEKVYLFKVRLLFNEKSWKKNDIPQASEHGSKRGECC